MSKDTVYNVTVEGLEHAEVTAPPITLSEAQSQTVPLVVRLPADEAPESVPFTVMVRSKTDEIRLYTTFTGPGAANHMRAAP
jgi:hypothetical protein